MIAFRRVHYNYSLENAVECAKRLNKPLVILEALRCGYPGASDRLPRFVIEGMVDNSVRVHQHLTETVSNGFMGWAISSAVDKHKQTSIGGVAVNLYPARFRSTHQSPSACPRPIKVEKRVVNREVSD